MLSIREIKERTEAFFKAKGVPDPKLNTDILIAHSLGIKRLDIYLDLDRPLTEAQLAELRPLVKRRALREPLQYILGSVEFCDLALRIDARALIPRPETEELYELICQQLADPPQSILDLGTGSGALAFALGKKYPEASVTAVDFSDEALSLARENATTLSMIDQIQFLSGSWYTPVPEGHKFDLVVSNPPYLTEEELTSAESEVAAYEPSQALVSGADGLDDLRRIIRDTPHFLKPGGLLALETGIAQAEQLQQLAQAAGMVGHAHNDMSGRPRFFLCRLAGV